MNATKSFLAHHNVVLCEPALSQLATLERRGTLNVGWPDAVAERAGTITQRLFWWPRGVPPLRTTSIVSSRWGRRLDRKDHLFRVLRTACGQLDPRCQALLTSRGTTTYDFVCRAAQLFGLSTIDVVVAGKAMSFERWLQEMNTITCSDSETHWKCYVSPSLAPQSTDAAPLRDEILVNASDQLLVLHLRSGGNLDRLLLSRLKGRGSPSVFLAMGSDQLVAAQHADDLMRRGAVGWLLLRPEASEPADDSSRAEIPTQFNGGQATLKPAPIVPVPAEPWRYLTHCTRQADGPWPDQDPADYVDELLLGHPTRNHSSLAALVRIVRMQRLIATGRAIRGGTKVVSLTSVSLEKLPELRKFQSHRGRWDFEPYGICIDREFLQSLGARPVFYGDETLWNSLAPEQQHFFQKTGTAAQEGNDWRAEQEWRHLGHLDLRSVPRTSGLVFVPSHNEAAHVAQISRWPVTVVDW